MFDQENLLGCIPEWDWEDSTSWRRVCNCAIFHSAKIKLICKLKLGSCAIWKECCSHDHWRRDWENVHHILRPYFNNIQEKDTPCSPHFPTTTRGNGVH